MEFVTNGWRPTIFRHCHPADPTACTGVIQNGSRLHKRKGIRMHLTKPAEETKLLTR
jgi:hypothetical protein